MTAVNCLAHKSRNGKNYAGADITIFYRWQTVLARREAVYKNFKN